MTSGLPPKLLLQDHNGVAPEFSAPPAHIGSATAVVGRVKIGSGAMLADWSTIRADGHYVEIGNDFCLGVEGTVHIAHKLFPTIIGDNVTAGHKTVIHACSVGDNCHFGENVVVLDGSEIGPGCAFEDHSLVYPGTKLEGGWLYGGQPAKPVRRISREDIDALNRAARQRVADTSPERLFRGESDVRGEFQLIAGTAQLSGPVTGAPGSSIWYACRLESGSAGIHVGENTNVQDNSIIKSAARGVTIGATTTIGHNATLLDCTIGNRCLIGIGSIVTEGTVVEDEVLLAASARTEPGQTLESGWLYAGSPAQKLKPMDEKKIYLIEISSATYVDYAKGFSAAPKRYLDPV